MLKKILALACALVLTATCFVGCRKKGNADIHVFYYTYSDPYISSVRSSLDKALGDAGYQPYYLYRQKNMNGNQENTGYMRDGTVCVYNVDNMEELCSVIAIGAGGISKRITGSRIERLSNNKNIEEYVQFIIGHILARQIVMVIIIYPRAYFRDFVVAEIL